MCSLSPSFSRGENKNKFSHTYALLESKDNSLAGRGSVSLRNERFYRGYRDRAGPPRSCIITPLLSDGLLYIRSTVCVYIHRGVVMVVCATPSTKERLQNNYSLCLSCLAPPFGLDKNSRCASAEPPSPSLLHRGIRSYAGWNLCMGKKRKRVDDVFNPRLDFRECEIIEI